MVGNVSGVFSRSDWRGRAGRGAIAAQSPHPGEAGPMPAL